MRRMPFLLVGALFSIVLFTNPSNANESTSEGETERRFNALIANGGDFEGRGKGEFSGGPKKKAKAFPQEGIKEPSNGFPLGYPFFSWGEINYIWDDTKSPEITTEGFHLDAYFEQGVDWFELFKIRFNTFAGFRLYTNDEPENYWDKVGLWLGVKAKYSFELPPISWGCINLGWRAEMYKFTSSRNPFNDDERYVIFANWSFTGDWRNLKMFKSKGRNPFPLGYPFSSWGELSYIWDDIENYQNGWLLDYYVEQGIDWFKFYGFTFNTFAGIEIAESDDSIAYWNNRITPTVGIKIKRPIRLFESIYAELNIGARGEYDIYLSSQGPKDMTSVVVYLQWSFDGDWKRVFGKSNK